MNREGGQLSEDGITLGELVRSVSALVAQVSKLSDKLDEHRDDIARRFDDLGDRYVRREVYIRDLAEVHARQDNYQQQTDVALTGAEDELRQVRKDAEQAERDRRAEKAQDEKDRRTELERIATQRHNDRIAVGLGLLTALILPTLVLIIAHSWHLS